MRPIIPRFLNIPIVFASTSIAPIGTVFLDIGVSVVLTVPKNPLTGLLDKFDKTDAKEFSVSAEWQASTLTLSYFLKSKRLLRPLCNRFGVMSLSFTTIKGLFPSKGGPPWAIIFKRGFFCRCHQITINPPLFSRCHQIYKRHLQFL